MGYSGSRARCVALQYPLSATRGVKEGPSFNKKSLDQNFTEPFRDKETISSKALNSLNKELSGQVSQSESGMFYELSNRKGMECEKYQDCSWFQRSPVESTCNNKLSLVESFDPLIDADEFGLPMQNANAQIGPWGDEYLEVFSDDIILEENCRLKEKNKNWISNENFNANKEYDVNAFDSCNINFSLKKTDSVDSMKNISSTNPEKVIPISYKERLNNANYGLTLLDEVKKEAKLYLLKSNTHLLDSDDSDLNIGREEVVEDINSNEDVQVVFEKERLNLAQIKPEILSDFALNNKNSKIEKTNKVIINNNFETVCLPIKTESGIINKYTSSGKFDLSLDICKLNFDSELKPTVNVNTPDLDFMDLVEFINEEMRQENEHLEIFNLTENNDQEPDSNLDLTSTGNQTDVKNVPSNNTILPQPLKLPRIQSLEDNVWSTDSNYKSTIDLNVVSNIGVSIAERIKTSSKRRTAKNIKGFIDTEDESSESLDDDDDDDDDDYDFREDTAKRKWSASKKRVKSNLSESSGEDKKPKGENSSYRERRNKNNEASRRSRQNRKARERHMYETLEEEERRNVKLKAEADVLEKQVTSLRQLLLQVVISKGGTT